MRRAFLSDCSIFLLTHRCGGPPSPLGRALGNINYRLINHTPFHSLLTTSLWYGRMMKTDEKEKQFAIKNFRELIFGASQRFAANEWTFEGGPNFQVGADGFARYSNAHMIVCGRVDSVQFGWYRGICYFVPSILFGCLGFFVLKRRFNMFILSGRWRSSAS